MPWVKRVVASVVLLSAPSGGAASQASSSIQSNTSLQTVGVSSPPEQRMVPYSIDTNTIGNWSTLNVGEDFTDITGAPTGTVEVPLPTEDQPFVYVSLLEDDVYTSGGGEDVLVFGKKDTEYG